MTFTEKRKYKRQAKLYLILAYVLMFTFIIGFILLLVLQFHLKNLSAWWLTIPMSCIFISLILGLTSQAVASKRTYYIKNIKKYREDKLFNRIMNLVLNNDFQTSVNLFNGSMPDGILKNFLFGFIMGKRYTSTNSDEVNASTNKVAKIMEQNVLDIKNILNKLSN